MGQALRDSAARRRRPVAQYSYVKTVGSGCQALRRRPDDDTRKGPARPSTAEAAMGPKQLCSTGLIRRVRYGARNCQPRDR